MIKNGRTPSLLLIALIIVINPSIIRDGNIYKQKNLELSKMENNKENKLSFFLKKRKPLF